MSLAPSCPRIAVISRCWAIFAIHIAERWWGTIAQDREDALSEVLAQRPDSAQQLHRLDGLAVAHVRLEVHRLQSAAGHHRLEARERHLVQSAADGLEALGVLLGAKAPALGHD